MGVDNFDKILAKNVPHILEAIFFSLDYESFKASFEVSNAWNELLTSGSFQKKVRCVFQDEILEDERKLWLVSSEGKLD